MIYADTDFFIALVKDEDWLAENARQLKDDNAGEIVAPVSVFIEVFLIADRYGIDREAAAAHMLEVAETNVDERVIFQAAEYIESGLTTFDAFNLAFAGGDPIISSDTQFDTVADTRIRLEEKTGE